MLQRENETGNNVAQENLMSANPGDLKAKLSTGTRRKRPSTLMQVATSVSTTVDSSLDEFIAEANATLDNADGWAIPDESRGSTNKEHTKQVTAELEAQMALVQDRANQLEQEAEAKLRMAQSQLAEAEARAAAADRRAQLAERASQEAKAQSLAAVAATAPQTPQPVVHALAQEPAVVPSTASARASKVPLIITLGAVFVGAFFVARLLGGNKTASAPTAPAVAPTPATQPVVTPIQPVITPSEPAPTAAPAAVPPKTNDTTPAPQEPPSTAAETAPPKPAATPRPAGAKDKARSKRTSSQKPSTAKTKSKKAAPKPSSGIVDPFQ